MKCNESEQRIDLAVDGMLTADKRRELDRHIESCPRCALKLRDGLNLRRLAGEWADGLGADVDYDVTMNGRVLRAIGSRAPGGEIRRRRELIALAVFCAVSTSATVAAATMIRLPISLGMDPDATMSLPSIEPTSFWNIGPLDLVPHLAVPQLSNEALLIGLMCLSLLNILLSTKPVRRLLSAS